MCFSVGLSACYAHARRDAPAPAKVSRPMVSIPSGEFVRGDLNGEPHEYPEKTIYLDSFRIDLTEVRNEDYKKCVEAKACDPTPYLADPQLGKADHPVVGVSWFDAEAFCKWVGKRLPTEAEWEYAAKGKGHRKWPWEGAFDPNKANTSLRSDFHTKTAPVKAYPKGESPFGVLNMAGNAGEWVSDYFQPTFYRDSSIKKNPQGPESGRERIVRGGSYAESPHLVRVSARRAKLPTESDNTIGIRCAAN